MLCPATNEWVSEKSLERLAESNVSKGIGTDSIQDACSDNVSNASLDELEGVLLDSNSSH